MNIKTSAAAAAAMNRCIALPSLSTSKTIWGPTRNKSVKQVITGSKKGGRDTAPLFLHDQDYFDLTYSVL
jgi:hypothetical protein